MARAQSSLPRRIPRSLEELIEAARDAAVTVSGADHSNWSGQLQNARHIRGMPVAGEATWGHGLRLDYGYVMAPLRQMYANPGVRHDAATLLKYRRAVETLFHEHVHLLSAHGTDHTEAEPYMRQPSVQALEEGVTEAYAFAKLNDFIDELGIEQIAPAIKERRGHSDLHSGGAGADQAGRSGLHGGSRPGWWRGTASARGGEPPRQVGPGDQDHLGCLRPADGRTAWSAGRSGGPAGQEDVGRVRRSGARRPRLRSGSGRDSCDPPGSLGHRTTVVQLAAWILGGWTRPIT